MHHLSHLQPRSAKLQTHCLKMTDFRRYLPNGSALWRNTPRGTSGDGAKLRCPWAVAGPGWASRRRVELPNSDPAPQVWRAPEGSAAVPVGGGGACPGFDPTHRATRQHTRSHWCGRRRRHLPQCRWVAAGPGRASRSTTPSAARVWRSRGRAAAHRHTQRPGPTKQPGPAAGSDGTRNTSERPTTTTTRRPRRAARAGTGRGSG